MYPWLNFPLVSSPKYPESHWHHQTRKRVDMRMERDSSLKWWCLKMSYCVSFTKWESPKLNIIRFTANPPLLFPILSILPPIWMLHSTWNLHSYASLCAYFPKQPTPASSHEFPEPFPSYVSVLCPRVLLLKVWWMDQEQLEVFKRSKSQVPHQIYWIWIFL